MNELVLSGRRAASRPASPRLHRCWLPIRWGAVFGALSLALAATGLFTPSAGALETRRVVFVVIDGARATEFFEQPAHQNTPRL